MRVTDWQSCQLTWVGRVICVQAHQEGALQNAVFEQGECGRGEHAHMQMLPIARLCVCPHLNNVFLMFEMA